MDNILERILADILRPYLEMEESQIDQLLLHPNLVIKDLVKKINDLKVIIYSNDHNPPHFHVISNDHKVNAKFLIENGEYLSGEISAKNLKVIKAFYQSPKTKILLETIWNKKS